MLGEIDLVRALWLGGIGSAVVAQPGNPARFSRAAVARIDWRDPWSDADALVDRLVTYARAQPVSPVLFYDGDWDLLLVSRNRERLSQALRFVVADAELVEQLVDKDRFQALARAWNLPVPRAVALAPGDEPEAALDLRFPLVAKPITRQHATWKALSEAKAVRVDSAAELRDLHRRLGAAGETALLQELIAGPESLIESYHVYVDADDRVAGEFSGRKLRTRPAGFGYTTALRIAHSPDVIALGREVVERLGLRGVAKLDFKRGADGRLHLLEINPRFSLWHHAGALAGVNLPALVYRDLVGLPRGPRSSARDGVRWCSAHDLVASRRAGMSAAGWLRFAGRCEAICGFARDDPWPLLRTAAWRLRRTALQSTGRGG